MIMKKILLFILLTTVMAVSGTAQTAKKTDVEKAGQKGRVKSVEETVYDAVFTKGKIESHTLIRYDAKGNEIEVNKYYSDGILESKYTYKYKYDGRGNWTERIEYEGEAASANSIITRTIEYYE
jgi:hypothetical protein